MSVAQKIRRPISDFELNRRWNETRGLMEKHGLDCIITQGSNMHLGGYVRWFTDIPAENNYHMTVFFPADGEMTLLRTSASPIPEWSLRGVEDVLYAPFCPSLNYTGEMEAGLAIDYLRERKASRLGYIGKAFINTGMLLRIKKALPQIEIVDITDEFDLIKAIKSEEEMELIREAAYVQDQLWSALPAIVKPGMYEYQIRAEVMQVLANLGSEEHLLFIGTAPQGKPCGMNTFQYANRRVNDGDYGTLLVEVSGPGGYYCESARNFSFGEPCEAIRKAWDVAVEAQQMTADMMVPGRDSTEIVAAYNKFVASRGYSQEGRLYGHSQGYDLIERPAFMAHNSNGVETMPIRAHMNCSLHPYLTDAEQTVYINDNYYVDENGATRIHITPPTIIIL